jgi:hypothetical protein
MTEKGSLTLTATAGLPAQPLYFHGDAGVEAARKFEPR